MDLARYIRDVPDFPMPGILFRDVTPLLQSPEALRFVLDEMAGEVERHHATAIIGIESRGFLFGAPVAARLGLPFIPVRKPGKLPAQRMSVEYALEYGSGQLDIHADALTSVNRVVVVDDLLATGGTVLGTIELVKTLKAEVVGLAFLVELLFLKGRERLGDYFTHSVVQY